MSTNLINSMLLSLCFLSLFGLGELMYHKFKVRAEFTRKLIHFGTGILTLLFPILLTSHWWVLFLCSSFAVLLIASMKFNFLKSINAIDRVSIGSILYPVSVYSCYLTFDYYGYQYVYFYLPILLLAICDPLAALFGKKWPVGKYSLGKHSKTLMGSSAFMCSAFILIIGFQVISDSQWYPTSLGLFASALIVAFISTLAEALSGKGIDNLTIPLSALGTMIMLNYF